MRAVSVAPRVVTLQTAQLCAFDVELLPNAEAAPGGEVSESCRTELVGTVPAGSPMVYFGGLESLAAHQCIIAATIGRFMACQRRASAVGLINSNGSALSLIDPVFVESLVRGGKLQTRLEHADWMIQNLPPVMMEIAKCMDGIRRHVGKPISRIMVPGREQEADPDLIPVVIPKGVSWPLALVYSWAGAYLDPRVGVNVEDADGAIQITGEATRGALMIC